MQTSLNHTFASQQDVVAVLQVHGPLSSPAVVALRDGQELVVGNDNSADLCLPGPDIAAMHCLIRAERLCVVVRDCYSRAGTYVHHQRISEVRLATSTEIRIGDFTLQLTISTPEEVTDVTETDPLSTEDEQVPEEQELPADSVPLPSESSLATAEADHSLATSTRHAIRDLELQLEQLQATNEALRDQLEVARSQAGGCDSEAEEMLELLRAEVFELQAALAAQSSLPVASPVDPSELAPLDALPREDAERLVDRLEQLLQELQQRDEQVRLLNDLLEAAEEANRAEQDERQQLKAWVVDIEQRIGAREEEWQAERTRLQQQKEALIAERDRVNATAAADSTNAQIAALQHVLAGLREEQSELQRELESSEAACEQLRRELEEAKRHDFREEEIRLSQERAELARMRHELEKVKHAPNAEDDDSDANVRVRALRQHLAEIHEQEKLQRQENSLGSRLSRLWSKLDRK